MRRQAQTLSLADRDQRLPVSHVDDELSRLGRTLNDMLARMRRAYEHERKFIDYASHELRTPLTALRVQIELALSRPRSNEALRQALVSAAEEADHLVRMSEDLLALGETTFSSRPLRPSEVLLSELTTAAWAPVAAEAERCGIIIGNEVPPVRARLDAGLTKRALTNLLANAVRHAPSGSTITVRARCGDGHVEFDVLDEGDGFPDSFLPVAFEPFRRGDTRHNGSGLGLALVEAVAQAHGGNATANNAPGSGASVRLVLHTLPTQTLRPDEHPLMLD